jgi:peroxiredoxin
MLAGHLNFGIPDVDLPLRGGGTVNPSCFAGHQLVVLFLPADATQRAEEFESYDGLSNELSHTDAWFVVVASEPFSRPHAKTRIASDPGDKAWRMFKEVAGDATLDRQSGAAFFFTRGGAFHRVWAGPGHAREVADELQARA